MPTGDPQLKNFITMRENKIIERNGIKYQIVYTPYVRDKKTGKLRYPKNARYFRFEVPVK